MSITTEELSLHNKRGDCWISIGGGQVFDISGLVECQIGDGAGILSLAGTDASEALEQMNPLDVLKLMECSIPVGYIQEPPKAPVGPYTPRAPTKNLSLGGISKSIEPIASSDDLHMDLFLDERYFALAYMPSHVHPGPEKLPIGW